VKRVADALEVSRSQLAKTPGPGRPPRYNKASDTELLERIKLITDSRPTNGYRRVTAHLNRGKPPEEHVNHKRVYRVMKAAGLLLPRYTGRVERPHDGKVITLKSNLRWCSDSFEIRCWNGEKVYVAFSQDCCDREIISWVASNAHLDGGDIRDVMAMAVDARFSSMVCPHPVEWLTDNGPPYVAHETRRFGRDCGLLVRNTPSYSPESNGMAEAMVKTLKRDYVYLADLSDAETVLRQLPLWIEDYNENHPHKGLKMRSPREYRRGNSA